MNLVLKISLVVYAGKVVCGYKYENEKILDIEIKDGTKGIADSTFQYAYWIKSMSIPNSVIYRKFGF